MQTWQTDSCHLERSNLGCQLALAESTTLFGRLTDYMNETVSFQVLSMVNPGMEGMNL